MSHEQLTHKHMKSQKRRQEPTRVPIQGRVDITELAAIVIFLEQVELRVHSRSDLLHSSVSMLHTLLETAGKLTPVDSVTEAYQILSKRGITWTRGTSAHKAVMAALADESDVQDAIESTISHRKTSAEKQDLIKKLATDLRKNLPGTFDTE